jgi:hypothetical protein
MSFEDGFADVMGSNPPSAEESSIQSSDAFRSTSGICKLDKDMSLLE